MTTPDLRPHVHNCLLLEDHDDESVVDSPSCDGCECMDAASCVVPHGVGSQQPLQTAATSTAAAAAATTTTTAAPVKNDGQQPPSNLVPTADLGSPSTSASSMGELGEPNPTSREHSYDLRSRIPRPPNAFMLFAQEKRRLVAAQNPNENNQIVSTRLGKMWLALSAADKDLYRRKAALEAAKHRKKYPDYVYNPLDARHRKEQERRAKQIAAKLMKGIEEPPAVTAKESGGASSHEQDKDSKEAGSAKRRLTMQRRRRRAAAGGITRTRSATHIAPRQTRKTPKQTTTAAPRRTAFVQAMATTSRPSAAFDEQRRLAAQPAQQRDATNGSAAPHASQFPAPATHQFDARMSLVSCGRDCAAVPCAQTHCPSTSCVAGDGTQPQGWFPDSSTQASAAPQTASGLATTPVLWLPLLSAAAAPAVAPSLSLLLPAEVAVHQTSPAVASPAQPFDAQPQHHAPARHDAVAGQMHLVAPLPQPGLSMAGEQQLHSPQGADWPYQPGAWGGPFTSDDDFGMHPFLGRSNGQQYLF
ncbi:uncharacterized protein LOC144097700 [Amblyomma americanum]